MLSMVRSARKLGLSAGLALAAAAMAASSAQAYEVISRFGQPEQIGYNGRLAVEASVISVINCESAGERGGQFWIYQYTNRPGYRAILPPHWSNALGGKDWSTFQEAASVACVGAVIPTSTTKGKVRIDDLLAGHGDDDAYGHTTAATPVTHSTAKKGLKPLGPPSRGGGMAGGGEGHSHY